MMMYAKGAFKEDSLTITDWDRPSIRKFNGEMIEGRPTKGYGVSEFNYAGKLYTPEPWTKDIEAIKEKAETWAAKIIGHQIKFTFCLCGLYETGDVMVPHHSDTVPKLTDHVLGISFGAPRILEWRNYNQKVKKKTNSSKLHLDSVYLKHETRRILLEDGDAYLFDGHSQMKSTHSIPALEGAGRRINLTFRSGL
jgi:alkylated DNA repair dioxygenase AlkB|tara:strand:+ start:631 stop:1215 length:585 start_codon:yes stop_codon:yes gene_type:complete